MQKIQPPRVDDDAVLWSRTPRPGDGVVLVLHGVFADEHELAQLVPLLDERFVYARLRGIHPKGEGWGWLEQQIDPARRGELTSSAEAVEQWAVGHGLDVVGAVGFSQGGILALELARRGVLRIEWVACLAGAPFPAPLPADERLREDPPAALWLRGDADLNFTPDIVEWSRHWLDEHATLREVVVPGLGHDLDDRAISAVIAFVAGR